MAANITYKCPTCGAELYWTAAKNAFECQYCGDSFTLDQMRNEAQEGSVGAEPERHEELLEGEYTSSNDGTVGSDLVRYSCSHCGAEIITDRATAATVCVYCGSPVIMGEQITDGFAPDYLIPFRYEKSSVMETFRKFSKKPLTPKDFDCDRIVDKLQGVYIPFWLYSAKCSARVNAEGKKVKTRHRKDHTEVIEDIFNLYRAGDLDFKEVPVDASLKTDNDAMDSIEPFDYKELVPFDPGYLSGYLAERYDEDKETCYARAKERIEHSTLEAIKDTCKQYTSVRVLSSDYNIKVNKVSYALLPTWLLYTTYNNKKYFFAMNGQTGRFIGNLPIDKLKLTVYSLLGGIAGSIIGSLILPFFFY